MTRATAALLASVALCAGCKPSARPSPTADAAPASSAGPVVTSDRAATLRRIAMAEHKRASSEIKPEDLSSRDVEVRRHAARALARVADGAALEGLKRLLSDEDPEVVAWSAYGLGYGCKGNEAATVRALVSRAATLAATPSGAKVGLDVGATLADALGRCGGPEAEATLRAWLDIDDKGEAAALALGRMASRKKRIDDASIVALLDAASRPEKPVAAALLAFTRIDAGSDAIRMRLYEVASEALAGPAGPRRSYAVRALGRSGDQAVPSLVKVLEGEAFTVSERSDAARELARVGKAGQVALQKSLPSLLPKPDALATLTGAAFSPLVVALESLVLPARDAKTVLEQIASLEPPKDQPPLARRVITLRCRAASILAGSAIAHPKLVSCDPDAEGATGRLALLEVLARDKLTGTRLVRFKELCESKSAVVRQAALDKLGAHPEATGTEQLLAKALRAPDAGTVATAAQVIASYPDRAAERRQAAPDPADSGATPEPIKPHPMVVDALTTAFTLQRPPDSIEVFAALADAAGALQVLSFKPRLDAFCKSANPTLREHAEKALRVMGEQKRVCKAEGPAPSPPELEQPLTEKTTLVFETDAGEVKLTLDPTLAPVATTRLVALTRAGFFEKNRIHRVVPGFVVQLGDPGGDGYGGAGKDPLACETSPVSFDPLSVGVALAGRDTGSSQFFVTLAAFPHLDGDYALIGRAEPGWERLAQGDMVQRVRVVAP
ncbi:MAG: peptidylprolyl isomerase [Myxococcales bacterium]|nr:peptidylprolyl isomerase [Myxococcales bacterium]